MRILVDIPESHVQALTTLAERGNKPRAALIRDAIAAYLALHQATAKDAAFGLWGPEAEDGVAYQRRLRQEW
jgi:predicted transcriptional regulator